MVDVIVKQPEFKNVLRSLRDAIGSGLRIGVYGDYDADGFCSLMTWRDTFRCLAYEDVLCFEYRERMRTLDPAFIDFCRNNYIDYYIICDTGSSDESLLLDLRKAGLTGVVIDHHDCDAVPTGVTMLNSTLISYNLGSDDHYCGSSLSWLLACELLDSYGITYDKGYLAVYSLLGQYADVVEMDSDLGKQIYSLAVKRESTPLFLSAITNDNTVLTRRLLEYTVAPKLNAAFRLNSLEPLNLLIKEPSNESIFNAVAMLLELHNNARDLVIQLREYAIIVDSGSFVHVDLAPALQLTKYSPAVILNFKGRVAAMVAEDFRKPCICICDNGIEYTGSFRSPVVDRYLSAFKSIKHLVKCGGHEPAFGFSVTYNNWRQFSETLHELLLNLPKYSDNVEIVDMLFGFDLDLALRLAMDNELRTQKPCLINFNFLRLVESKFGFSYLVANVGDTSVWCESKYRLYSGSNVLMKPFMYNNKLKFSVAWQYMSRE